MRLRDFISICETFLLLEDRIETVRAMMVPKIKERLLTVPLETLAPGTEKAIVGHLNNHGLPPGRREYYAEDYAKSIFVDLLDTDPDPKKIYTQWICRMWLDGKFFLEDRYKVARDLNIFNAVKSRLPPELRDINRFKSPAQVYEVAKQYRVYGSKPVDAATDAKMRHNDQAWIAYNSDRYEIIVPKTKEAACHFGRDTEWCTANPDPQHNRYNDYRRLGMLYIIWDKENGRRWQLHMQTGQFMDEDDHPVNLLEFTRTHPEPMNEMFGKFLGAAPVYSKSTFDGMSGDLMLAFFETEENGLTLVQGWNFDQKDHEGNSKPLRACVAFYLDSERQFVKFQPAKSNTTPDWIGNDMRKAAEVLNTVHAWGNNDVLAQKGIVYMDRKRRYEALEDAAKPLMTVTAGGGDTYWKVAKTSDLAVYTLSAEIEKRTQSGKTQDIMTDLLRIVITADQTIARWLDFGQDYRQVLGKPIYELLMTLDPNVVPVNQRKPLLDRLLPIIDHDEYEETTEDDPGYWRDKLLRAHPQWGKE